MMVVVVYLIQQEKLLVAGRNNMQNIYEKYSQLKFPMGTGSSEWWEIKTDFEILDDAVIGLSSTLESNKLDPEELKKRKEFISEHMHIVQDKINNYSPVDDVEESEKVIAVKKVDLISKIYSSLPEA
jgi:hypothetical protein